MSRKAISEEERRRRRNEASRRCYLKRKAELAAQAQPVGAKNKKPKAKAVETKPARAKPARRGPDPIVAAERLCKIYAKVANGVKPMIKDAAEFLGIVYKSEDQRVVEKVERILTKGLGVSISRLASDPIEKTRVCLDAASKAVKTPKFRLTTEASTEPVLEPAEPEPEVEAEPAGAEPAEVLVDPALIEKVDAGEADKSEIEIPRSKDDKSDEDDEDDSDSDFYEDEYDKDDEDEDDEDDESEEAQERRARRREREESDNVRDWESGRWEMMGEMGAQGAFDD